MNVGIFAVVTLVAGYDEKLSLIDDYRGLIYRSPLLGSLLIFFLVSLIGIPFTGGFFGKFYSFSAAVGGGAIWLAIIGLLNSGLAAALLPAPRPRCRAATGRRPGRTAQARRSAQPSLPLSVLPLPLRSFWASFPAQPSTPPNPPRTRFRLRRQPMCHASHPSRLSTQPRPPPLRYNLLNEAR